MIVIGIDPGLSGCLVAYEQSNLPVQRWLDGIKYCWMTETEREISNWLSFYSPMGDCPSFAFIESVHSMPRQGVASSFKFGQSYGFLRGLLVGHGIPFEEVTPQKWQKEMGCLTKGDKNVSKARAQQLFPREKIVHANADALLIAEYGRRVLNQRDGRS